MPSVRIVGAGRAGSSLAGALASVGWSVEGLLARDDDPSGAARDVDLLVIATPDAEVAAVSSAVEPVDSAVVVHLAGSLGVEAIDAKHQRRGALHPLVAMPDPEVGERRLLDHAWFAVAGDSLVRTVVDELGGRWFEVADDDRVAYHAAAVIASNHLVAVLGQAERVAQAAGVPFEAYLDLVKATVENVVELGPADALTGPAARGDWATIERHLTVLPADERELYEASVRAARRLVDDNRDGGD